ncbi:hypothetical protein ELQ35_07125 [Peribacillus cavernae]|uniref:DUF5392 family protein n=1 Tax=Peribacillus cavernae TaxID=1674310 RepID=A0A3S0VE24_9BACI|nr:DUF5392 family protein [Peribacillus cavernae]MDQ0217439.1 hypothetical protein [Peribacillus cavernae]RUQ30117.1 hypothetical protein ELQ35_07125 [Peribacillus cavernae]
MNVFMTGNFSDYVKNELEQLQKTIAPVLSKTTRYAIWAFPLMTISFFNLFFLLFYSTTGQVTAIQLVIYALLGALGLALSKERKINQKEVQKLSNEYMIKRIENSSYVNDYRKKSYVDTITEQPLTALNSFIEFINEEEKVKKQNEYN